MLSNSKQQKLLEDLYYNPSSEAAFSGVLSLQRAAQSKGEKITRKDIKRWLSFQKTYGLHFPARRRFPRGQILSFGVFYMWQIDLAVVSDLAKSNSNQNYILCCVDTFSKMAYCKATKTKQKTAIASALQEIFDTYHAPLYISCDRGLEFWNSDVEALLKKYRVHMYATRNVVKAAIVENFIRILKNRIYRFIETRSTKGRRYIDHLQDIVDGLNKRYHRSIKMRPVDVSVENQEEVFERLFPNYYKDKVKKRHKTMYEVGSTVRVSKFRSPFSKGYRQNFSEDLYTISEIVPREPPLYKLKDKDGDELVGTWYSWELTPFSALPPKTITSE